MDIEEILHEILTDLLNRLGMEVTKISITEEENENYFINISSENPSELIGYHGDNIQAIQHILKTLAWKKTGNNNFNILLDVDNYRKRQEENVMNLAKRKIAMARKTRRPQNLPPMNPFLRRKIHLLCMEPGMDDIETLSQGEGDRRHIVIKLK
ncbi:KH domain-containing protein [Candidatus Peregrinibacteria bacterium]|nr:KH domain-containing protein [Candidatus Peregrinibacteria bacterium]